MKKIILLLAVSMFSSMVFAQQEPMYGQYIFNNIAINPAQAGAAGFSQWGVLARFQFLGISGGPRTNTVYANLAMPRQMGLSFSLYHDRLGIEENLQFQSDVAYHAQISETFRLSGGIRLLLSNNRIDFLKLEHLQSNDPYFASNHSSGVMMNVGAGLLLSSKRSYFGFSLPRVFSEELQVYNPGSYQFQKKHARHLFAYAGTNISMAEEFVFLPSALFKYSSDAPVQLDLNGLFSYRQLLDFGPLIRSNLDKGILDAVGFMVGLRLFENWYFGYMYEYPTNDLNLATRQTHELTLRFLWGIKEERIRSPRYFL